MDRRCLGVATALTRRADLLRPQLWNGTGGSAVRLGVQVLGKREINAHFFFAGEAQGVEFGETFKGGRGLGVFGHAHPKTGIDAPRNSPGDGTINSGRASLRITLDVHKCSSLLTNPMARPSLCLETAFPRFTLEKRAAASGTRTRTSLSGQRILSPVRLPFRHGGGHGGWSAIAPDAQFAFSDCTGTCARACYDKYSASSACGLGTA